MDAVLTAERELVDRICGEISEAELTTAIFNFRRAQRRVHHYRDRPTFAGYHDQLEAETLSAWAELVAVCKTINSSRGGQQ